MGEVLDSQIGMYEMPGEGSVILKFSSGFKLIIEDSNEGIISNHKRRSHACGLVVERI